MNNRVSRERVTLRISKGAKPQAAKSSLKLIPDAERDAAVGQFLDVGYEHRQSAAELRAARWRRVGRERVVHRARIRHRARKDARPRGAIDSVRLFENRPVADNPPDQQSLRRQTHVEALLA